MFILLGLTKCSLKKTRSSFKNSLRSFPRNFQILLISRTWPTPSHGGNARWKEGEQKIKVERWEHEENSTLDMCITSHKLWNFSFTSGAIKSRRQRRWCKCLEAKSIPQKSWNKCFARELVILALCAFLSRCSQFFLLAERHFMDFHDGFMKLWLSIGFSPSGSTDVNALMEGSECIHFAAMAANFPGDNYLVRVKTSDRWRTATAVATRDAKLTF